eukprot:TRINITY_DN10990_c0_g1_i1.p1 TRINITY_DN10990_c0_g1~~TRINITY_DN10990_c0_g1_i1.p1  ORF type:complete len:273 (+),score=35.44 TRINITY_DN10990_c0_g1_i1:70-888(+)
MMSPTNPADAGMLLTDVPGVPAALCREFQPRVGRWASIESLGTLPSRMGSIDAMTPGTLFPATPTPTGHAHLQGPFDLGNKEVQLPEASMPGGLPASGPWMSAPTAAAAAMMPPTLPFQTMATQLPPGQQPGAWQPYMIGCLGAPQQAMLPQQLRPIMPSQLPTLLTAPQFQPQGGPEHMARGGLLPSAGSTLHSVGQCSPCAWFWKAKGCKSGADCTFCHLCPQDELKKRKRAKLAAIRNGVLEPKTQRGATFGTGQDLGGANLKLSEMLR